MIIKPEDIRGRLVMTHTIRVYENGHTDSTTDQVAAGLEPSKSDFWNARRFLVLARRQLTEDIQKGPKTCPFGALNPDREGKP